MALHYGRFASNFKFVSAISTLNPTIYIVSYFLRESAFLDIQYYTYLSSFLSLVRSVLSCRGRLPLCYFQIHPLGVSKVYVTFAFTLIRNIKINSFCVCYCSYIFQNYLWCVYSCIL